MSVSIYFIVLQGKIVLVCNMSVLFDTYTKPRQRV
jgi:hypothetical protein